MVFYFKCATREFGNFLEYLIAREFTLFAHECFPDIVRLLYMWVISGNSLIPAEGTPICQELKQRIAVDPDASDHEQRNTGKYRDIQFCRKAHRDEQDRRSNDD